MPTPTTGAGEPLSPANAGLDRAANRTPKQIVSMRFMKLLPGAEMPKEQLWRLGTNSAFQRAISNAYKYHRANAYADHGRGSADRPGQCRSRQRSQDDAEGDCFKTAHRILLNATLLTSRVNGNITTEGLLQVGDAR